MKLDELLTGGLPVGALVSRWIVYVRTSAGVQALGGVRITGWIS